MSKFKPISILAWFLMSITMIIIPLFLLCAYAPIEWFPQRFSGKPVLHHFRNYRLYKSNHQPQNVLVGASYVSHLRNVDGFVNLACGGTNLRDHIDVIKRCRSTDTIYIGITYRDISAMGGYLEKLKHYYLIPLFVAKRLIIDKFQSNSQRKRDFTDTGLSVYAYFPHILRVDEYLSTFPDNRNITFVLMPVNMQYKQVRRTQNLFRTAMKKSDCKIIDLSDILEPDQFTDVWHHTKKGRAIIQQHLLELTCSVPQVII